MANEVYGILYRNVHPVGGDADQEAVRDDESFLRDVITPIYHVLRKVLSSFYSIDRFPFFLIFFPCM